MKHAKPRARQGKSTRKSPRAHDLALGLHDVLVDYDIPPTPALAPANTYTLTLGDVVTAKIRGKEGMDGTGSTHTYTHIYTHTHTV